MSRPFPPGLAAKIAAPGQQPTLSLVAQDLQRRKLSVAHTLQYRSGEGWVLTDQLKTRSSRRTIDLTPELTAALAEMQRAQLSASPEHAARATHPTIFRTPTGTTLTPQHAKKALRRATRGAGFPDITPHDLRHTCATLLLGLNVHPKKVQDLLGHTSIAQAVDTYSHLLPGMSDDITQTMSSLFGASLLSDPLSTPSPSPAPRIPKPKPSQE